jgi:hypothetical protein
LGGRGDLEAGASTSSSLNFGDLRLQESLSCIDIFPLVAKILGLNEVSNDGDPKVLETISRAK